MTDFRHVTFISAGAGSGKTYRLTQELKKALLEDGVDPAKVVATTFTVKAASELNERVRSSLIQAGRVDVAERVTGALIGTVHVVCERLLSRFAFELGLSPTLTVLSEQDRHRFFAQALDQVVDLAEVRELNQLADRLGQQGWQGQVSEVCDQARQNDVTAGQLRAAAATNAAEFLQHLPDVDESLTRAALLEAVTGALTQVDLDADTTKGTARYVAYLQDCQRRLEQGEDRWPLWMSLTRGAQASAGKRSDHLAQQVRDVAERYPAHPGFQDDVARYATRIVELAASAIERFQALKKARGLIDFTDMEQLTLSALGHAEVADRLADEIDLLLVDEFQDTSPMQLALFLKLVPLARRVIFVGDVKQAIYGFRGSDPDLVFRTLDALAEGGAQTDRLAQNWRSTETVVRFFNEFFCTAFGDELEAQEVVLEAQRQAPTEDPAVQRWLVDGKNREAKQLALATAVLDFVSAGPLVADPDDPGVTRRVRWSDVAVLTRTNQQAADVARTLRLNGIPVRLSLDGLLDTAEVALARACLKRVNDASDTVATAEVLSLACGVEVEDWLAHRLGDLEAGGDPANWAEADYAILGRLAALRDDVQHRSPVEIVARTLNETDARAVVAAWGPDETTARQRQRNLDAFLDLAVAYERHCGGLQQAATLTGFLFWLEQPSSAELDLQPVVTEGDAVHVLTYHKSKGLEWPVVVATALEEPVRSRLWGVRWQAEAFRMDAPLSGRTLRFWPNLFGRRSQPLLDAFEASDEGRAVRAAAVSEERRLAYVGFTRARDRLVLVTPSLSLKPDAWLEAVHPDSDALPLDALQCVADDERWQPEAYEPNWFIDRTRAPDLAPETVTPSSADPLESAAILEQIDLGPRMRTLDADMTRFGSALHAMIAAELVNPGRVDYQAIAEGYRVTMDVQEAIEVTRRFRGFLDERFPGARVAAEVPVARVLEDGRVLRGWIDVLLETEAGFVVIDHKSSPRPRAEWPTEVTKYAGQLLLYRQALPRPTIATFVHLPVGGAVLEVGI